MQIAPGSTTLTFEVTFNDPSLPVAMSVYDLTTGSPVLVQGPSAMSLVADYTYQGHFSGTTGRNYVIIKAVYTDGGFTVLDPNYSQGSESIVVVDLGGGSSSPAGGAVIGFIDNNNEIIGIVQCA